MAKWIEFEPAGETSSGLTKLWHVKTKGDGVSLGWIRYRPSWRQYVYEPNDRTTYEPRCLEDIAQFLREATLEHRKRRPLGRDTAVRAEVAKVAL